ncbi:MAG: hypothetical protein WKF61_06140 [Luteimonas sp.]
MNKCPDGLIRSLSALYGEHVPMTPEELAAFQSDKARVMAADEARGNTSPQPDLLDEAA